MSCYEGLGLQEKQCKCMQKIKQTKQLYKICAVC